MPLGLDSQAIRKYPWIVAVMLAKAIYSDGISSGGSLSM